MAISFAFCLSFSPFSFLNKKIQGTQGPFGAVGASGVDGEPVSIVVWVLPLTVSCACRADYPFFVT